MQIDLLKVVLRYKDGKVHKGFTQNFFPNKDRFHLFLREQPSGHPLEVFVRDLKAVFIVRDFRGEPKYNERKDFGTGEKSFGVKIEVTFQDGEILVGSTLDYSLKKQGFFLLPADPRSNNQKAYLVLDAVKYVRQLR